MSEMLITTLIVTVLLFGAVSCHPTPENLHREVAMYRAVGDNGAEVLHDRTAVHTGDRIRPCVVGGTGWVNFHGQDGTGDERRYGGWALRPGKQTCAPFSLRIDDKPGPERFWIQHEREPAPMAEWSFPKP